jgi:hypothetical protein
MQCKIFLDQGLIYTDKIFSSFNFWAGYFIFFVGMAINIRSDDILGALKKEVIQRTLKGEKK